MIGIIILAWKPQNMAPDGASKNHRNTDRCTVVFSRNHVTTWLTQNHLSNVAGYGGFLSHRATHFSSSISNDGVFPNKNPAFQKVPPILGHLHINGSTDQRLSGAIHRSENSHPHGGFDDFGPGLMHHQVILQTEIPRGPALFRHRGDQQKWLFWNDGNQKRHMGVSMAVGVPQ